MLAGTSWWLVPLLLQGRYSFNIPQYTEQSVTTFWTMSAAAFLRGAGNWEVPPEPRHPVAAGGLVGGYLARSGPRLCPRGRHGALRAGPPGHAGAALAAGQRGPRFRGGADRVRGAAWRPAQRAGGHAVQRGAGPAAQPLQDRAGRRRRAGPRLRARGVRLDPRRAAAARRPGAGQRGDRAAGRACPPRARGAAVVRPGTPAGLVQPGARVLGPGGRLPGRQLAPADGAGRPGGRARPLPVGRPHRRPAGAAGQLAVGRARPRAGGGAGLRSSWTPPSRPSSPARRCRACPCTWPGPASGT